MMSQGDALLSRWTSLWLLTALVGCAPEYDLGDPTAAWGEANAPHVGGTEQVDRILQVVIPVVDVLWVIDGSPSMIDDRSALATHFPAFIEPFEASAVDWHVGVVTTDMESEGHRGQLQTRRGYRWLDADTPDLQGVFTAMTTREVSTHSTSERGREAAWTALELEADGYNAGFLRDQSSAWLHVTVVTDEDDDTDDQVVSIGGFADFLRWIRPYEQRVTFNSIVALDDTGVEERGEAYITLSSIVGGEVYDLNGSDWPELLDELGGLQAPEPDAEFFLSRVPVPDTIEVSATDPAGVTFVYGPADWVWSEPRNSVTFTGELPPLGATLELRYEIAGEQP